MVDDQKLIRTGPAMMVDAPNDTQVAAQAADGADAVAVLTGTQVDIVLMDVQMPGTDSVNVLAAARIAHGDSNLRHGLLSLIESRYNRPHEHPQQRMCHITVAESPDRLSRPGLTLGQHSADRVTRVSE